MRKLIILCLVLTVASAASATELGFYRFSGNMDDSSGQGNHGSIYGPGLAQYAFEGAPGSDAPPVSKFFAGSNFPGESLAQLPPMMVDPVSEYTIDFWFKPAEYEEGVEDSYQVIWLNRDYEDDWHGIELATKGYRIYFEVNYGDQKFIEGPQLEIEVWAHVQVSFNGTDGKIGMWYDGVNVACLDIPAGATMQSGTSPLIGGAYSGGGPDNGTGRDLKGLIDEMIVSDVAIPEPSIMLLVGSALLAMLRKK